MNVKIIIKTSGRNHEQAATHLYNPHPRPYSSTAEFAGSVCYTQVSPSWDGWELRDGVLADVTCKKCQQWAAGAHKRELKWLAQVAGWLWYPNQQRAGPKRTTRKFMDRREVELERWQQFTGKPHPGMVR